MIIYVESSAILAWLLGEPTGEFVRKTLGGARRVVTSALTGVECARALLRARVLGRISATQELATLQLLAVAESQWDVHALSERVLARARASLPGDPVRTLDALHVATAMIIGEQLGSVSVLSFDLRVRECLQRLGLPVLPA